MESVWKESGCSDDLLLSVIAEVSSLALENGGEVYRAEEMCERIGTSMGATKVNVLAIPTALCIALDLPSGERKTTICRVKTRSTRLDVLDSANTISRQLAQHQITLEEAYQQLQELRRKPRISSRKAMICAGGSAAFFAMLYGGGLLEFGCALIAGFCAYIAMNLIGRIDSSQLIKTLAGSFTAAIVAGSLDYFLPAADESLVIIGAIMPMLPGLAVTNAIRDMMHGDLVSGNVKLFEGILTACAIAAGVGLALHCI